MDKLSSIAAAGLLFTALLQPVLLGQQKKSHAKKAPSLPNKPFEPGCPLPFASIAVPQPIDKVCPRPGNADPGPHADQNAAKNNFCAPDTVTDIKPQDLLDLQQASGKQGIPFGGDNDLPKDRKVLQALPVGDRKLGEGMRVRMKAFLIEAHFADLGSGESVNCNRPKEAENDIHIALGDAASDQECASFTAEISPHSRPKSWDTFGAVKVHGQINKEILAKLQKRPLRFTGQLFFDASHHPCSCGLPCVNDPHRSDPLRKSLWEIHPVYAIDVCKDGTACDVANDAHWVAFDKSQVSGAVPKKKGGGKKIPK